MQKTEPVKAKVRGDDSLAQALRRLRQREAAQFVREGLSVEGPVLEVGEPWLSEPLRRWNIDTESCDRSAVSTQANRNYSAIALIDTLMLIDDPIALLETITPRLNPQGRLFVRIANASSWQFVMFGEEWSGLDAPRRRYHFRAADLVHLLEYCGYVVERTKQFALWDSPASLATTLAPGLDPSIRQLRGVHEHSAWRLLKTTLYASLGAACIPFTAAEAACQSGSVLLVEARRR